MTDTITLEALLKRIEQLEQKLDSIDFGEVGEVHIHGSSFGGVSFETIEGEASFNGCSMGDITIEAMGDISVLGHCNDINVESMGDISVGQCNNIETNRGE
jgi:hypothetical protein